MRLHIQNCRGFSLVEFLIAIAILGIGLLALVGLQTTAIRGNLGSKNMTTAVLLIEKKMEELKNYPFSSTSLALGTYNDPNNPLNSSGLSGGTGAIFNRSWTIQSYAGSLYMKQITVSVSWTEAGHSKSTSCDTIISK